ncbi:kinase-like protein, partial [Microstroma glucosiphilum]
MAPAPNAPGPHKNLLGHRIADGRLELVSVLGLGAYGVVYLARDLKHPNHQAQPSFATSSASGLPRSLASGAGSAATGYYAVKCLSKVGLDARQRAFQRREIMLHTIASNHSNVVTLHRVIDSPEDPCVYVILDYCPDGDLFSMITEHQRYMRASMDAMIKKVFCQIIDAVEFCHSYGIYHRDLKPENILCLSGGSKVVLADFGLATGEKASTDFGCGSTFYMGPECQGGITTRLTEYSTAANDIWSLGVILVNLTCGRNPWKQACTGDETFREYLRRPDFLLDILPISDEANEILKRIFTVRPEWRISTADLRKMILNVRHFTVT